MSYFKSQELQCACTMTQAETSLFAGNQVRPVLPRRASHGNDQLYNCPLAVIAVSGILSVLSVPTPCAQSLSVLRRQLIKLVLVTSHTEVLRANSASASETFSFGMRAAFFKSAGVSADVPVVF